MCRRSDTPHEGAAPSSLSVSMAAMPGMAGRAREGARSVDACGAGGHAWDLSCRVQRLPAPNTPPSTRSCCICCWPAPLCVSSNCTAALAAALILSLVHPARRAHAKFNQRHLGSAAAARVPAQAAHPRSSWGHPATAARRRPQSTRSQLPQGGRAARWRSQRRRRPTGWELRVDAAAGGGSCPRPGRATARRRCRHGVAPDEALGSPSCPWSHAPLAYLHCAAHPVEAGPQVGHRGGGKGCRFLLHRVDVDLARCRHRACRHRPPPLARRTLRPQGGAALADCRCIHCRSLGPQGRAGGRHTRGLQCAYCHRCHAALLRCR